MSAINGIYGGVTDIYSIYAARKKLSSSMIHVICLNQRLTATD